MEAGVYNGHGDTGVKLPQIPRLPTAMKIPDPQAEYKSTRA